MSTQQIPTHPEPLTYEKVLDLIQRNSQEVMEMFRKDSEEAEQVREQERKEAEQVREQERKVREQERKEYEQLRERERKKEQDAWNKRFGEFSDRLGELIEAMVEGRIVRKFQRYNYTFGECSQRHKFENKKIKISGEFDLFLQDGDYVLGIEVKLKFTISDVKEHITRLQKYRQYLDAKEDKRKILAAVAGGVIPKNVKEFAIKNGLFVIKQSGEAFEIFDPPEGFTPKEW
ncbi:hypothetical protein FACS189454_00320 [Planctomycetales bacterium]|nr:hypothetical protein FACS189454_00320 [Planctomycetales bacterium]